MKKKRKADPFADTIQFKAIKKVPKNWAPPEKEKQRGVEIAEDILRYILYIAVTVLLTAAICTSIFALYCYSFNQEAFEKCKDLFCLVAKVICVSGIIIPWLAISAICIIRFFDR